MYLYHQFTCIRNARYLRHNN